MADERKRLREEEWKSMIPVNHRLSLSDFPSDFLFGVATSAYQVEGAANEGGRGPCIWDAFSHTKGKIKDGKDGDVAVDQYHRYKEDVDLIAKLGFRAYRFSISWSRIYPDGLGTKVNKEGIMYYNNLINYLLEKGVEPCVTLYHWDIPLHLDESMGGWLSDSIPKYFAIYAETCFANFGDRVKKWITINEPLQTAVNGYFTGVFAPGKCDRQSAEPYLASHHQLLAHAEAVSIYRTKYKDLQGGEIGLVVDCEWAEALTDKEEDIIAAARRIDFQLGWYLDPIFFGEYPKSMQERLGDKLPKFSEKDKDLLKNSLDFVGLNHYTSRFVSHKTNKEEENYYRVQEATRISDWENGVIGEKAASSWLYVVPWGLRRVLNYIAQKYNNPPIYITENGMDDEDDETSPLHEMLDDKLRVTYFKGYLASVSLAIKYLDPIFFGEYPKSMQERLGDKLPKFSEKDKDLLKNSLDFVGLNHYTSRFVSHKTNKEEENYYRVQEATRISDWENGVIGEKAASSWLYVVPWGLRRVLNYIAQKYNNPPIYITENGMDDEDDETSPLHEMLDDKLRVTYFKGYLASVSLAIKEGVDVRGYFAWSLVDNFEWAEGYTKRFGLIYVDYKNGLARHPKSSAYWFRRFLKGEDGKNGKEN